MSFEGRDRPRKFSKGVVYIVSDLPHWIDEPPEHVFVVLGCKDEWWNDWLGPEMYVAFDLLSGQMLEFHKHSLIAEKATPLLV